MWQVFTRILSLSKLDIWANPGQIVWQLNKMKNQDFVSLLSPRVTATEKFAMKGPSIHDFYTSSATPAQKSDSQLTVFHY